jgi:hypothetical protein
MLQDLFVYVLGPIPSIVLLIMGAAFSLFCGIGFGVGYIDRYNRKKDEEEERAARQRQRSDWAEERRNQK